MMLISLSLEASVGNLSCARLIANPRLLKSRTTTSEVKKRLPRQSREPGGRSCCRSCCRRSSQRTGASSPGNDVWFSRVIYEQPMLRTLRTKRMKDLKKKSFVQNIDMLKIIIVDIIIKKIII